MKVSELEGAELDYWTAKAEGCEEPVIAHGVCFASKHEQRFWEVQDTAIIKNYSSDWSQGGPIIEREGICLAYPYSGQWAAFIGAIRIVGPTPLIAAMRAYVASKFGEEVG